MLDTESLNIYKSTLTPQEVDEALKNISKVKQSVQEAKHWADVSKANAEHPIGYIFQWAPVSGQNIDLSTPQKVADYFGYGKWAAYAAGQVMAGVNSSHGIGTIVGAETHQITTDEMPAHAHVYNGWAVAIPGGAGSEMYALVKPYDQHNNFGMNTKSAGDGAAMSLMQPTKYVYIWQRIG